MFIVLALNNVGAEVVFRARNSTISLFASSVCWYIVFCSNTQKSYFPHRHVKAMVLHVFFVTATVKRR